jgi:3-phenylpropionate/cinnamic acid dioxygenase small subunit
MAVFDFIEGRYNSHRRHSALDYPSPINYERSHPAETGFRRPTPSTETGVGPIVVGFSFIQEIGENGMAKNEVIERFAIQDLLARYAHAIDDLNPEEWARCFTPDGVFQLGSQALRGHAALRAYGEVHVREIRCRHMTGNFLYKIDGNKATGQASVLATLATPGGYKFFAQGRYVDQLVKQRGQWLIAHRRVDLDPLASDPEKIVGLSDPDVAPLFQPLIDAWARLGEKV